jgi:gluconate kinase
MLDTQFADLEEPAPDEDPLVVSIGGTPEEIVKEILAGMGK